MKKILSVITLFLVLVGSVFAENHNKKYRTSPRENGKYYAIESSYDGGKTWHSTGDSSPDLEEANRKMENMKKGLTASGLTQEEAKASIPEGTPTIGNSDQNSETKSTKKRINKRRKYVKVVIRNV